MSRDRVRRIRRGTARTGLGSVRGGTPTESSGDAVPESSSQRNRPSSRRTVLRGAAWSAPAIVIATAAPAYAASGAASITQTVSGVVDSGTLVMTTTVDFLNSNTGATTATVVVRLGASAGQVSGAAPGAVSPGWAFVSSTPAGSAAIRWYTFSGTIPGATDASGPSSVAASVLSFTVPVEAANLPGPVSAGTIWSTVTVPAPASVTPVEARGAWGPLAPPP